MSDCNSHCSITACGDACIHAIHCPWWHLTLGGLFLLVLFQLVKDVACMISTLALHEEADKRGMLARESLMLMHLCMLVLVFFCMVKISALCFMGRELHCSVYQTLLEIVVEGACNHAWARAPASWHKSNKSAGRRCWESPDFSR